MLIASSLIKVIAAGSDDAGVPAGGSADIRAGIAMESGSPGLNDHDQVIGAGLKIHKSLYRPYCSV